MKDDVSDLMQLSNREMWYLLTVLELFTHNECLESTVLNALILRIDTAGQIIDPHAKLSNLKIL